VVRRILAMKNTIYKKPKKKGTEKKITWVPRDPVEAYRQGWKDGRADLVKVMGKMMPIK
jgi:hypothetical protein